VMRARRTSDLGSLAPRSQRGLQLEIDAEDAEEPQRWLPLLQGVLAPAAWADLHGPGVRKGGARLRKEATHYFDTERRDGALRLVRRSTSATASHFESIATTYWEQIPAHVQDHFFAKKIGILEEFVPRRPDLRGLDLGCGVGRYAAQAQRRLGGQVIGLDPSRAGLVQARTDTRLDAFLAGDVLRLPFRDGSFDYAYTINVLHHLKRGEQERGLRELRRVLRPDGVLIVHEMNIRNPLFHWYLRRLYPKLRPIDRGDEEFIRPDRWPLVDGLRVQATRYMTFIPDFAPKLALKALRRAETWLESQRTREYSAHYAVVLRPD
jgi:ubiquinone/menaquinone biosynthesis C-methylase UbiE